MSNKQRIIDKINALLAKTPENGCTEAEASMAFKKAQSLMMQYTIEQGELGLTKETCVKGETPRAGYAAAVANALADTNNCKVWMNSRSDTLYFFGLKSDVDMCIYFYQYTCTAINEETTRYQKSAEYKQLTTWQHGRTVSDSFRKGMSARIAKDIRETHQSQQAEYAAQGGTALVLVKNAIVNDAYAKLGMRLGTARRSQARTSNSYSSGFAAGGNVSMRKGVAGGQALLFA